MNTVISFLFCVLIVIGVIFFGYEVCATTYDVLWKHSIDNWWSSLTHEDRMEFLFAVFILIFVLGFFHEGFYKNNE